MRCSRCPPLRPIAEPRPSLLGAGRVIGLGQINRVGQIGQIGKDATPPWRRRQIRTANLTGNPQWESTVPVRRFAIAPIARWLLPPKDFGEQAAENGANVELLVRFALPHPNTEPNDSGRRGSHRP